MKKPPNLDSARHWLACYVMMSRAKSLPGLLILRPATRCELDARPPQYLIDEIDRLLRLEERSHRELLSYITDLQIELPTHIQDILSQDAPTREAQLVSQHRQTCSYSPPSDLKRSAETLKDRISTRRAKPRATTEQPRAYSAPVVLPATDMPRQRMLQRGTDLL